MTGRLLMALTLLAVLGAGRAPAAEEPAEGANELSAAARAALDSYKYEEAAEALEKLAKAAPGDARLATLRLEFLARVGRFEEAAEAAKSADAALAEKLPLDVALRIGRALAAAGQPAEARKWILGAARRAGPALADRAADSLAALLAPQGGEGLVTRAFAVELVSPEAERAEAVNAYKVIAEALKGENREGPVGGYLGLAHWAACRRLEELLGENLVPSAPKARATLPGRLLWQVPVGVDERPEFFAAGDGRVVVASQVNARGLPGRPLAARLRAFDARTGAQRWSLEFAPKTDAAGAGADDKPGASVSYNAYIAGLAVTGGQACALVKTERFERRGASRTGSTAAAALIGVDLASGKTAWTSEAPRMSDRLYLAGKCLVVAGFRNLAGYAAADGRQLWSQELERALSGEGAVAAAGVVLPGWREVICIEPDSGKTRWTLARAAGTAVVKKCVSNGALVALGETDPGLDTVRMLDGAAGKELWSRSFSVPRTEMGELGLVFAGPVLVASRGAALRGISAADGNPAWRAVLPPPGDAQDVRLAPAGSGVLWCVAGAVVGLDAQSGKPVWWSPSPQGAARPLDLPGSPEIALVLTGLAPRMLSAWRLAAEAPEAVAAREQAARKLIAIAEKLAAGGKARASQRLLEIARTYATPGVLEVELAVFRQETAAGGGAGAFVERGLFAGALAATAGGPEKAAAIKLGRLVLEKPEASEDHKCLAAAALVFLGDEAGAKYLAANPAVWAGNAERRGAVVAACRSAGAAGAPVLVAGLAAGDGTSRAQLAEQLAAHKTPEVRAALEKLLADPDRAVRMVAASSLVAVAGAEAVGALEAVYKREDDFIVRERLRELLASLGRRPDVVGPRPRPDPPDPTPTPGPGPTLTREQAVEKLAKEGKVLWSKPDSGGPTLTWIAVDKKFVFLHNAGDGTLTGYGDFLKLVGRAEVTAAELAFGVDSVWAATDRGAFCYDRRTRAWSQMVINLDMELVEAHVEKVELTEGGVAFTVKDKGRFEFNTRTRKWSKP